MRFMSQLRILLAEDNPVNQKIMLAMLKKLGYSANVASNGAEVLLALQDQMYDLVLMDIQMPLIDGIDATRIIREQWPHSPKIVVITAFAFESCREVCLDAGANDFLAKPIKIEELKDAIDRNAISVLPEIKMEAVPE